MAIVVRDQRVCFIGDSFVAGIGEPSGLGWVGRIAAESSQRGVPLTTYNLGVRRDTSLMIEERLIREVAPRLAPAGEPRIVLSFGVNDTALDAGRLRVSMNESVAAFTRIHGSVGKVRLFFVGPPAVDDDEHNERISALNGALMREAARLKVPFAGSFDGTFANAVWRRDLRAGDGFHPNSEGYEQITSLVREPLHQWLTSTS
jgi:acyl-CoA thioesterase I